LFIQQVDQDRLPSRGVAELLFFDERARPARGGNQRGRQFPMPSHTPFAPQLSFASEYPSAMKPVKGALQKDAGGLLS
jgi:hypothetical protein